MLNTDHWQFGDTGKYFYFEDKDFSKMVGSEDWNANTFDVRQAGSQDYSGLVKVWKETKTNSGAYGRRVSKPSSGQWKANDTIRWEANECEVEGKEQ